VRPFFDLCGQKASFLWILGKNDGFTTALIRPNPHLTPALSPPSDGAEREKRFPPLENTSDGISPTIIHQPKDAQNASLSLGRGPG
jgi:hypothetical protein